MWGGPLTQKHEETKTKSDKKGYAMKRICSLVLILCLCLSAMTVLTACGDSGEKNAYQQFIKKVKNNNDVKEWMPDKEVGNFNPDSIGNSGYKLNGEMHCSKSSSKESFTVFMKESFQKAPESNRAAYYYSINYTLEYSAKENQLTAYPTYYQVFEGASEDEKGKVTWTDGCYYGQSERTLYRLSFDMSKYFANGSLTLEDATVVTDVDASTITRNQKIGDKTYTERYPEWESELKANFIVAINEALGMIDAYIATK